MSEKKKICDRLNPFSICKKYKVGLWQCPQFLFTVMGVVIIAVIISTYFLATQRLRDPFLVALIALVAGGILLVINFVITNSFERMAQASRMKGELVSIVSHQLRAPLTNIRFALDFLTSDKTAQVSREQSEYHSILKENSKRMGDLVDNLLTVSKIETGNFPLKSEPVSIVEITRGLVEEFKSYTDASNINVILNISDKVGQVWADPLWLRQVAENLLDNAIKYTKGGGKIEITIVQKGIVVHFRIKDYGVGIPKEDQGFVFEKFFRSGSVLKGHTHGSGLGLHIVKRVIELSGGKVGFESKEGQGTTFYFNLPVLQVKKVQNSK